MANISIVSELVDAVMRNVDLSVNTLVTGAIKVGGSSGTDLTKSILDSLISSGDASSLHNHNTLYYTKTLLNATGTGTAGSTLVGDDNNYLNFSNTAGTVKGALQAIDSALAGITSSLDGSFRIKNSGDNTKQISFSAAAIATGTTRQISMPDSDVNLADVNLAILNDGSRPMAGELDAGNFNIINVLDPVNPQDTATKAYVDAATSGGGDLKADGTVPMTGNLIPETSGTVHLGDSGHLWQNLYLRANILNESAQPVLDAGSLLLYGSDGTLAVNFGSRTLNTVGGTSVLDWSGSSILASAPISTTDQSSNPTVVSPDLTLKTGDTLLAVPGKIIIQPGTDQNDSSQGELQLGGVVKVVGSILDMNSRPISNASLLNVGYISIVPDWNSLGSALVGIGPKQLNIVTEDIGSGVTTQDVVVQSGNGSGTVNSGDLRLATGSVATGTRGSATLDALKIYLKANEIKLQNISTSSSSGSLTQSAREISGASFDLGAVVVYQAFTPTQDITATDVIFAIGKASAGSGGTFQVHLYDLTGGDTTTPIASAPVSNVSSFPNFSTVDTTFTFSSPQLLTAGTTYAVGIDMTSVTGPGLCADFANSHPGWSGYRYYNGSIWQSDAVALYLQLDYTVQVPNPVNITNVADPVNPQDAATKAYVDSASGGANTALSNLASVNVNAPISSSSDITLRSTGGKVILDSSAAIQVNNGIVPLLDGGMNIGTVGKTAGQIYLTNAIRRGNGNKVLSVSTQNIYDVNETVSVDFGARTLHNSSDLEMLDWSGSVLDAKTHKITNVVDPTNPQDAATKAYVDAAAGGGGLASDWVSSNSAFSPAQSFGGQSALVYNVLNNAAALIGTVDAPSGDTTNNSTGINFVTGAIIDPTSNHSSGSLDIATGYNYGTGGSGSIFLETGYCANPGPGGGNSGDLSMYTGDNGSNTGLVFISSGNSSGGNSGDLTLATGTAASGTRGKVILNTDIVAFDNWTWTKNGAGHDFDPSFKFFGYDAPAANILFGSGDVPNGNTTQASSVVGLATGSVLDATSTHNSGSLSLQSGAAYGSGNSGDLLMGTGYAETGNIGEVQIFTSVNGSNDRSGNITLVTGASGSNRGKVRLDGVFVETSSKFLPDTTDVIDLGSGAKRWGDLYANSFRGSAIVGNLMANSLTTPSGQSAAGLWSTTDFVLYTNNNGTANANPTNTLYLESGNKTAGTGNSGNIKLTTGTSVGGVRGNIVLDGLVIDATSKNIVNVADPSSNQHAATKKYVDDQISALAPGASTTLANLTAPTSINQELLPDSSGNFRNIGSAANTWSSVFMLELQLFGVGGAELGQLTSIQAPDTTNGIGLRSTDSVKPAILMTTNKGTSFGSPKVIVATGNTVDGNSGDIKVRTGVPTGTGTRGKISLEALTVALPQGTSDPTGVEGDVYYNTSTHKMMLYDGTSWVALN